jgi:hypothetical protein
LKFLTSSAELSWNHTTKEITFGKDTTPRINLADLLTAFVVKIYILPGSELFIHAGKELDPYELYNLPSPTKVVDTIDSHWIRFEDKFNFV